MDHSIILSGGPVGARKQHQRQKHDRVARLPAHSETCGSNAFYLQRVKVNAVFFTVLSRCRIHESEGSSFAQISQDQRTPRGRIQPLLCQIWEVLNDRLLATSGPGRIYPETWQKVLLP